MKYIKKNINFDIHNKEVEINIIEDINSIKEKNLKKEKQIIDIIKL